MRPSAAVLVVAGLIPFAPAMASECSNEEVGYIATFKVAPGREAEFEQVVLELAGKVRELEPGVLLYAPYRGETPGVYYMLERYENEEARATHASAEEIRALFPRLTALLQQPPSVQPIATVCP